MILVTYPGKKCTVFIYWEVVVLSSEPHFTMESGFLPKCPHTSVCLSAVLTAGVDFFIPRGTGSTQNDIGEACMYVLLVDG